jgi:hypothetical protein
MRKLAILLVLLSAGACSAQAQLNGVTAELKLVQDQYLPDEEVQLKLVIANRRLGPSGAMSRLRPQRLG